MGYKCATYGASQIRIYDTTHDAKFHHSRKWLLGYYVQTDGQRLNLMTLSANQRGHLY